jgi:hypothetical protein
MPPDDDVSLELKLARQARDEAAADHKAAAKDLAEAQYLREQVARDLAQAEEHRKWITQRQAGATQLAEREKVADQKLAECDGAHAAIQQRQARRGDCVAADQ